MLTVFYVLTAACCAALSNYFMRKNLERKGSINGFLLALYTLSLTVAVAINHQIFSIPWNPLVFTAGGFVGALNILLMLVTAMALLRGPAGLTFAFQNSGSVFPAVFLFLLFGSAYGFILNQWMIFGLIIVLVGLFWAAETTHQPAATKRHSSWIYFALMIFAIQTLALTLMQWRCLLYATNEPHALIPITCDVSQDRWFMPAMFSVALALQIGLLVISGEKPRWFELAFGGFAGVANAGSTFFLLLATPIATPQEKVIIFPLFAVGVILLCNLWSRVLYQEPVNWRANALCCSGIFIASINN